MRFKAKRRAATITSESSDNDNENIKKKKSISIKKKLSLDSSLSSADIQYIVSKHSNGLCNPTIYSYGQYCDGIGRAVSIFINNPTKNHWATITNHMDHD